MCFSPGGGEDVDFCLQQARWPLLPVPRAVVHHPWWQKGARDYTRFSGWARGDGRLMDLHPRYAYRRLPNLVEVLAAALLGAAAWGVVRGLPAVPLWVVPLLLALCAAELGVEIYRCFLGADRSVHASSHTLPAIFIPFSFRCRHFLLARPLSSEVSITLTFQIVRCAAVSLHNGGNFTRSKRSSSARWRAFGRTESMLICIRTPFVSACCSLKTSLDRHL